MKLKSIARSILFLGLAAIPVITFANSTTVECPNPDAVKAVPFSYVGHISDKYGWIAYQPNGNYGTEQEWAFEIVHIQANNLDDATRKAKHALSTLNSPDGPYKFDHGGYYCNYSVDEGYRAYIVTPY